MRISLNMLAEGLEKRGCAISVKNGQALFSKIQFWPPKNIEDQKDTLFVLSDKQICSEAVDRQALKLLIYSKKNFNLSTGFDGASAVSCCPCDAAFDLLLHAIDILFDYNRFSDQLILALSHNRGVNAMVDIAHTYFGNPCTVVDNSQKVIAYTHDDHCEDKLWKDSVSKGYIAFDHEDPAGFLDLQRLYTHSEAPILVERPTLCQPFLSCPIRQDEKIIGSFNLMAANMEITPANIDVARYFCEILSLELGKNEQLLNNNGMLCASLIIDILEQEWTDEESVLKRMRSLNWRPEKNYYAVVLMPNRLNTGNELLSKICRQLQAVLPSAKSVVYSGNIVAILSSDKEDAFNAGTRRRLAEFSRNNHLKTGVSLCYHNISDTTAHYKHAQKALKAGMTQNPEEALYFYKDYTFMYLRDILAEHEDLNTFCHAGLFALSAYDKKHQTTLTNTLRQYLLSDKSPTITAQKLDIHRSTLAYRLKKIQEIMKADLSNPEEVFDIHLSFKLLNSPRYNAETENAMQEEGVIWDGKIQAKKHSSARAMFDELDAGPDSE